MKPIITTHLLRLTFEAPIEIPRDVVEAVIENSTAREAIWEGVWNWLPYQREDDEFEVSLSIVDEP